MRTATVALGQTNSVTGSLSYIDTLVTEATAQGKYQIMVGPKLVNDSMIGTLIDTYGYTIQEVTENMGTYKSYLISW
jgi:hypothetical protein